jgi:hypothetical protein
MNFARSETLSPWIELRTLSFPGREGLEQAKGATKNWLPLSASKWLPIVDEFRNFLMSKEADTVLEHIKDF